MSESLSDIDEQILRGIQERMQPEPESDTACFLAQLDRGGALVRADDCSGAEVAIARSEGKYHPGFGYGGYVLRSREWLAKADANVTFREVQDIVRRCGPATDA